MKMPAERSLKVLGFSQPTLILIANHVQGDFWRVKKDIFEHIKQVREEQKMVGDKKGAFVDTDSGYVHASFGHIDDERLKRFITRLANTSSKLLDKTKATRLCLILPKDMARLLTKQLPLADQKKLIATKTKDLTKQPFLEVINRLRTHPYGLR